MILILNVLIYGHSTKQGFYFPLILLLSAYTKNNVECRKFPKNSGEGKCLNIFFGGVKMYKSERKNARIVFLSLKVRRKIFFRIFFSSYPNRKRYIMFLEGRDRGGRQKKKKGTKKGKK